MHFGNVCVYYLSDLAEKYSVYRVTLNPDEIYCLGPYTRVLSTVSGNTFVIAIENEKKEEALRIIHTKGGNCRTYFLYRRSLICCVAINLLSSYGKLFFLEVDTLNNFYLKVVITQS